MTETAGLETQQNDASNPQDEIDLLNRQAWELRLSDAERSLNIAQQACELSRSGKFEARPYQRGLAWSMLCIGHAYRQLHENEVSLAFLSQAFSIAEMLEEIPLKAHIYHGLGDVNLSLGNYAECVDNFLKAVQYFQECGDLQSQAEALNALGSLHSQVNEPEQALTYLEQCLQIARANDWLPIQAAALDTCAVVYAQLGNLNKALDCAARSAVLYQQVGDKEAEIEALNKLGQVYQQRRELPPALRCCQQALLIARAAGFHAQEARSLISLAKGKMEMRRDKEALSDLQQALKVAEALGVKALSSECHWVLSQLYKQRRNSKKALAHYEQYHAAQAQINTEQSTQHIRNLETTHQLRVAKQQNEIYRLENVTLRSEIEKRQRVEEILRYANYELQQSNTALNEFAQTVAHDLKNPLSNLSMSVEILLQLLDDSAPAEALEMLQVIKKTGNRMNTIINELLLLASLRRKDITLYPLNMDLTVNETLTNLRYLLQEYRAVVVLPESWPTALGHIPWIEEVWSNYIINALKYGGKPPRLEFGSDPLPGEMVRFWLKDNGDGISPENQQQLFTPFERLGKIYARGEGLGLSIVKRIVENLGGEVGVESQGLPGEGSTFSFTLRAIPMNE